MMTHKIITIGRQFGSGGHEIGNLLATRLDIPLYDNNLVRMAAEKMDIREETAKAIDETSLNSFVSSYLITPMGYSSYINSEEYVQPLSEQMYELQTEIIKKLAERGPCVIVGQMCRLYPEGQPNCINVFICADRADRIKLYSGKDTMCLRRKLWIASNVWTENENIIMKLIKDRNGEASVLMTYY